MLEIGRKLSCRIAERATRGCAPMWRNVSRVVPLAPLTSIFGGSWLREGENKRSKGQGCLSRVRTIDVPIDGDIDQLTEIVGAVRAAACSGSGAAAWSGSTSRRLMCVDLRWGAHPAAPCRSRGGLRSSRAPCRKTSLNLERSNMGASAGAKVLHSFAPSASRQAMMVVGLAVCIPVGLTGCGSSAPPVEAPAPEAPPAEVGQTNAATNGSVVSTPNAPAAIRAYLADHFVTASWYPAIRAIKSGTNGTVLVDTSLSASAEDEATAGEICGAALSSRHADSVIVRFATRVVSCH
jgi:hypothetical protein